jgi:hemolysin activation/secretion protein
VTRTRLISLVIGLIASFTTVVAFAVDVVDPLNKREPARPGFLPPNPAEPFTLPPVEREPKASAPGAADARYIETIVFRGNTVIPTSELAAIAAPYRGRRVSAAEIEELREALTRYYIDRGYISSGALLEADAPERTLVFRIVEGKISAVRLRGMDSLDEAYVADRLVREADGPVNIDMLRERYQMLLGDPLIGRMNARLIPHERQGEAILDIDVVRNRPYALTAYFNNYHSPAIGSEAIGIIGSIANLTGRGDRLDLGYQDSTQSSSGGWATLAWSVPLNYTGTSFNVQLERDRSAVVEYPLDTLNIRSTLESVDLGIAQVISESLRQRFAVGVNAVYRQNKTTLLGEPFSFIPSEPDGVSRAWTARLWQEYAYRLEDQVVALRSTFNFVTDNAQETPGLPETTHPDGHYLYWLGQAQYARQVLDNGGQIVLRGTVQATSNHLLPLDLIPIGGVYSVRGYRENQIVRDTGQVFNAEFHYPLLQEARNSVDLWVIPFYDWGRGKNQDEQATVLASYGLAARFKWRGLQLDVSKAWRLQHPSILDSLHGTAQDRGVNFQVTCALAGFL